MNRLLRPYLGPAILCFHLFTSREDFCFLFLSPLLWSPSFFTKDTQFFLSNQQCSVHNSFTMEGHEERRYLVALTKCLELIGLNRLNETEGGH